MTNVRITLLPGDGPTYERTEVEINGVICNDVEAFKLERMVDKPDKLTLTLINPELCMNHVFNSVEVGVANTWRERIEKQQ